MWPLFMRKPLFSCKNELTNNNHAAFLFYFALFYIQKKSWALSNAYSRLHFYLYIIIGYLGLSLTNDRLIADLSLAYHQLITGLLLTIWRPIHCRGFALRVRDLGNSVCLVLIWMFVDMMEEFSCFDLTFRTSKAMTVERRNFWESPSKQL